MITATVPDFAHRGEAPPVENSPTEFLILNICMVESPK
jgi:hypothetical protein